jgi:hypothetical protein
MSKMWMVCGACVNAQALNWREDGLWGDRDYTALTRNSFAAFDVAARADYDQPARPGADSNSAVFFLFKRPHVRIA